VPENNSTEVSINIQGYGSQVVYAKLIVRQPVLNHHDFSFSWDVGDYKSDTDIQIDIIKKYLGAVVDISFGENKFAGIITQITVDELDSDRQIFVVKGQSPSILLDDVPKSASYYKKKLDDVVKKSFDGVQGNLLRFKVESAYNLEELHYVTQYNETDFQFVSRLAIRYGEWFYYDGEQLVFAKPGDSGVEMENGVDLYRLQKNAIINPSKYNYKSWDSHAGENISKELSGLSAVANTFSEAATDKSEELFSRQDGRVLHTFNVVNKKQLDVLTTEEKNAIAARMLTIRGEGKNPGLKAGCKFKVKGKDSTDEYIATDIIHYSNVKGHYENTFSAVPAAVKSPGYTNPHIFRQCGVQSAMVKENHDSDGIGRIRVQFHWQSGSDMSPWIRVSTPHAGGGKGMHFIPEKGEEVIVDFEGGDADKPFVLGSMFNGKAKSGQGDGDNNMKMLQSRSGCKVLLDDNAGSVLINDKTGDNKIFIDGTGNIAIESTASILLMCGSSSIELKSGGEINIVGSNVMINGTSEAVMGTGAASFFANSGGDAEMSGMKSTVNGSTEVTVTGMKATLNGDGTTDVTSAGPTSIAGAIVKLN